MTMKRMKLTREEAKRIQAARSYASMLSFLLSERRKIDRKIKQCRLKITKQRLKELASASAAVEQLKAPSHG